MHADRVCVSNAVSWKTYRLIVTGILNTRCSIIRRNYYDYVFFVSLLCFVSRCADTEGTRWNACLLGWTGLMVELGINDCRNLKKLCYGDDEAKVMYFYSGDIIITLRSLS